MPRPSTVTLDYVVQYAAELLKHLQADQDQDAIDRGPGTGREGQGCFAPIPWIS